MAWQVGDKLHNGKYTILQKLGHSGFGQTYIAEYVGNPNAVKNPAQSAQKVVLKHLKQEPNEEQQEFLHRQTDFMNEALRLASCDHPHIVKVYPRTFWGSNLAHMVMEYIEGDNLEVLLKQRQQPLSIDEALRYIDQVAQALNHIHSFDPPLIHRDIKPANIVLRQKSREAVVVDFGSAKEVRSGSNLSTKAVYTAGYSAIEIYTGVKKDTYTDVYSLGATLYFLLTKVQPTSVQERVMEDIQPPIAINPNISERVSQAIVAAMEIKPKERVQTVSEFLQRLGIAPKLNQFQWLFGARVEPSSSSNDRSVEQSAKIAAAEKQLVIERQRREQEEKAAREKMQRLEADKQRLARELQQANAEKERREKTEAQERQHREREANAERERLQKVEADNQRLERELQQANAEKERQNQLAKAAELRKTQEPKKESIKVTEVFDQTNHSKNIEKVPLQPFQGFTASSLSAKLYSAEPAEQIRLGKVELRSARGIYYNELEKLLKAKEWQSADRLTSRLIQKLAHREKKSYLWVDRDFKSLPCEDLFTIDRLWFHYSDGLYGFIIQKQIYVECGGKLDFSHSSDKTWDKFCDRTALKSEGKWLDYPDQFFLDNFMKVNGHLPSVWESSRVRWDVLSVYLFSRIETCRA
ncbi:MAG: GUN4 domain-containing protein [Pseudanabaena sp. CAN_BIN31]|nr:GUN4 domain-containing protein [Pseudanabaena sp. CAN_BIN31]